MSFKLSKYIAEVEEMTRKRQFFVIGIFAYLIAITGIVVYYTGISLSTHVDNPRSQNNYINAAGDDRSIDNPLHLSALEILDKSGDTRKEIVLNGSEINILPGESYVFDGLIFGKDVKGPAVVFTVYQVDKHQSFGITESLKRTQGNYTISVDDKHFMEVIRN